MFCEKCNDSHSFLCALLDVCTTKLRMYAICWLRNSDKEFNRIGLFDTENAEEIFGKNFSCLSYPYEKTTDKIPDFESEGFTFYYGISPPTHNVIWIDIPKEKWIDVEKKRREFFPLKIQFNFETSSFETTVWPDSILYQM